MRVLVITPPAPVVSLEEAKAHLRVLHEEEDALITRLIAAATASIDGHDTWLGRALGPQTLEAHFYGCPTPDRLVLPSPPIIAVESVTILDTGRASQTIAAEDYIVIDREIYPTGDAAPWATAGDMPDAIRVRYRAGFVADPEADPLVVAVPEDIRSAILLMVTDLYRNRETAVTGMTATKLPLSLTVETLLARHRVYV